MHSLPSFEVRNLGPIAEGSVKLHPLTILIGKSNTGKTYMAQAIYSIYKALERANGPVKPPITVDELSDVLSRIESSPTSSAEALGDSLRAKADDWMRAKLRQVGRELQSRLTVYFDLDNLDELTRWRSSGGLKITASTTQSTEESIELFELDSDQSSSIELPQVAARHLRDSLIYRVLNDTMTEVHQGGTLHDEDDDFRWESSLLAEYLWEEHLLHAVGLNGTAHYLPAGRSGLLEAWTDVVRIRLEQDREGLALTGREPAALGGIAFDFLLELQELIRPSRHRRRRAGYLLHGPLRSESSKGVGEAASHLEALIGGNIGLVRGREQVPSLTYTTPGRKGIPVQRASSMVAELAPLLSWIKHLMSPGDLLLIDEPEAHMHPEAVLAVAQTLVALSQTGVKILCTTHSSEFLHQVSNCMLRASLPKKAQTSNAIKIRVSDLGVYRFERHTRSGGTIISPIIIDPVWGIPEDEHIAVAERLAEETATLVESL